MAILVSACRRLVRNLLQFASLLERRPCRAIPDHLRATGGRRRHRGRTRHGMLLPRVSREYLPEIASADACHRAGRDRRRSSRARADACAGGENPAHPRTNHPQPSPTRSLHKRVLWSSRATRVRMHIPMPVCTHLRLDSFARCRGRSAPQLAFASHRAPPSVCRSPSRPGLHPQPTTSHPRPPPPPMPPPPPPPPPPTPPWGNLWVPRCVGTPSSRRPSDS